MTKCEVCDFKYPEHCGADINTGEPTDLDEIRKLDGMSGSEFAFLTKVENDEVLGNGVWLMYVHPDDEGYQMMWDYVCLCDRCPKCGRRLTEDEKEKS